MHSFSVAKKALHAGVVIRAAGSAHAADYAVFLQHLTVSLAAILAAAVAVKNQPVQVVLVLSAFPRARFTSSVSICLLTA